MSRELWEVEPCNHGKNFRDLHGDGWWCKSHTRKRIGFDAIWDRYYEAADRRNQPGLTEDELRKVVFGE